MTFVTQTPVRFAHVDGAGIVFYPRYFEMLNAALEDFFAEVVGMSFHKMHFDCRLGVPTVTLEADFVAPGRLGELLDIAVAVTRCGGSSAGLEFTVTCAGEPRLTVRSVIVCMDLETAKSVPWPAEIRAHLTPASAMAAGAGGA